MRIIANVMNAAAHARIDPFAVVLPEFTGREEHVGLPGRMTAVEIAGVRQHQREARLHVIAAFRAPGPQIMPCTCASM